MKRKNLFKKIEWLVAIVKGECREQTDSLVLLEQQYSAPWPGDTVPGGHTLIVMQFKPEGSLYRVLQQYFLKGELQRENNWLTRYSGSPGNMLTEIGGYRYCVFDAARSTLYLEDETVAGAPVVTLYRAQQSTLKEKASFSQLEY